MFDGTEDWCKLWRKTDLCYLKWNENFGKFSFTVEVGITWWSFCNIFEFWKYVVEFLQHIWILESASFFINLCPN